MTSITVLSDIVLPKTVVAAAGLRGKSMRRNTRVRMGNGQIRVNKEWDSSQRQYELGFIPMHLDIWTQIEGLYETTDAGAYGFLMVDPKDSTVAYEEGVAVGLTSTTFRLYKRYTSIGSTRTLDRVITRPLVAGFALKISGVLESPANYSVNPLTGVLTTTGTPTDTTLSWTGTFYVPVHFASDDLDWALVSAGDEDTRLMAGPSVVLDEIRE